MKVILLKNVPKLGKKDDIVEVSEGYANNALFPKKLAIVATNSAVDALNTRQKQKVAEKDIQNNLLDRFLENLKENPLVLKAKVNEKGSLFQKIDEKDISKEILNQHSIEIPSKELILDGGAIRQAGEIKVSLKGHNGSFMVIVEGV